MAVRIKLGDFQSVSGDCLGRSYIGCFPRMSEGEAWQAGRGVWKMNRSRAAAERFALVAGMGKVLAVAEVEGLTQHGDRFALEGHARGRAPAPRRLHRPPRPAGQPVAELRDLRQPARRGTAPDPSVRLRLRPGNCPRLRAGPRHESSPAARPRALRRLGPGPCPVDRQCPPSSRELSGPGARGSGRRPAPAVTRAGRAAGSRAGRAAGSRAGRRAAGSRPPAGMRRAVRGGAARRPG